jgi:Domain of unknown function (DUF6378)
MEHKAILGSAAAILRERNEQYGDMTVTITRACDIYGLITGKTLTAYEANIFLHALKLARIRVAPAKKDSYIDGINYLAFAGEFATAGDDAESIVNEGMKEMVEILSQKYPAPEQEA